MASEMVLALDEEGDAAVPEACGDLVDRLYVLESAVPQRVLGWLLHECTGDWILRLDDDEVPSAALLDGLPSLLAERRVTNIPISRRWLYPDAGRYIIDHPWVPDYQIRLVRNLPGIWQFPGLPHDDLAVLGERRLADQPIYHADLLINSYGARRAKRESYEQERPGHANQGFPVNLMYTPEDVGEPNTAAVPPEDADLIAALVEGSGARGGTGAAPRRVPRRTAEYFWPGRRLSDAAYRARLAFVRPPRELPAGTVRLLEVVVDNLGDEWWPAGEAEPAIRAGYRWLEESGAIHAEGPRSYFTESVAPGRSTRLMLVVEAPREAGTYILESDVVHEHVRWFGEPVHAQVEVQAHGGTGAQGW